jgi:glutamate-1-semialdehyde 2,1-aminomutase
MWRLKRQKSRFRVRKFRKSEAHLNRAELTIPLGSQTFSKSRTQYPVGISPLFIKKAKGCHVWDLDGNKYIDLVSALASVTLGYGDSRVNTAVRKQLKRGVSFSLPGTLEAEVAEMICHLVPSAEMVRFGKNATDVTTAAVRLARAYTGKDRVVVCGYHGWQDWFIGSTSRNKGVPKATSDLTEVFKYNDLESLRKILSEKNDVACVVMEPMNSSFPNPGFLEGVRELTKNHGVVLVFDETITGFRFSEGGAQELFNVIPDISTFGKGIANGFPLSVISGKREIMMEMEEIFFSGTFGGELLSLAAAKSVLELHINREVISQLEQIGLDLQNRVNSAVSQTDTQELLSLSGHPTWIFLNWREIDAYSADLLKTYFMQEMFQKGILILGTHNVNLAHTQRNLEKIEESYLSVLSSISNGIKQGDLQSKLKVAPLRPLFKVR